MVAITTPAESTSHWKEPWFGYDQFNRERRMDSFVEQLIISSHISEVSGTYFPKPLMPKSVASRVSEYLPN